MKTPITRFFNLSCSKLNCTKTILLSLVMLTSVELFSAYGQAGSLDLSFGNNGIVMTPIGNSYEGAYAVLVQPDGKIIAAGYSNSGTSSSFDYDFAVMRYNPDGSLDNTFGNNGKVTTDFGSTYDYATSALLQPDGKIVLCGKTYINGNSDYGCALARYNTDGSLDTSFDGDGKVTYDINPMDEIILKCALQPDGKILAAGYSYLGSQSVFAVLRFTASGALDNTFASGGVSRITYGTFNARCTDITVLPGGKILAAGRVYAATIDFALAQLDSNGTLDNTFGTGGQVTTDFAGADDYGEVMTIQPDGKIIEAGFTGDILAVTQFAMIRYNASGTVDNTFGVNGKATTALSTHDEAYAITLQPDLKILVAGRTFNGVNNDFGVARYLNNGTLDSTFNGNGEFILSIGNGYDEAFALAVQTDSKILVAGRTENADDDFAVIRLLGDVMTSTETPAAPSDQVYLFPNPAGSNVNIDNIPYDAVIRIYDLSGRMVYTSPVLAQRRFQLDTESLPPGTFLCEIRNASQTKTLLFSKLSY